VCSVRPTRCAQTDGRTDRPTGANNICGSRRVQHPRTNQRRLAITTDLARHSLLSHAVLPSSTYLYAGNSVYRTQTRNHIHLPAQRTRCCLFVCAYRNAATGNHSSGAFTGHCKTGAFIKQALTSCSAYRTTSPGQCAGAVVGRTLDLYSYRCTGYRSTSASLTRSLY